MKIVIPELEGEYEVIPKMTEQPGVWGIYKEKSLGSLKEMNENRYILPNFNLDLLQPIAAILTRESRKHFLKDWAMSLFPVSSADDEKVKGIVLHHNLNNTRFMFVKKGKDGETRLLKRWITQWELMTEITMAFTFEGVFLEFPFELSEEEEKLVNELIDTETDIKEELEKFKQQPNNPFKTGL